MVFKFSQNIFLKEFNKSKTLHSFLWVINIHFFCMGWTVALRSAIWISYRATVLQLVICIIYTLYPKYLQCFTKFRSAVKEEAYKKKPMTDGLTDRRRLGKKTLYPSQLVAWGIKLICYNIHVWESLWWYNAEGNRFDLKDFKNTQIWFHFSP